MSSVLAVLARVSLLHAALTRPSTPAQPTQTTTGGDRRA